MKLIFSLLLLLLFNQALAQEKKEILVSAASSLKDVFTELGKDFEKKNNVKVVFNFAASGLLKTQIETGAPVDVFASASAIDIEGLEKKDLLLIGTKVEFAKNEMVLAQNANTQIKIQNLQDLKRPEIKRIALGNPKTVPAGRYAKEVMDHDKIFDSLNPKMVFGENVRQVLDYIVLGEVDAGFVFATDLFNNSKVIASLRIPSEKHGAIIYPMAVVKTSKNIEQAKSFIQFVTSKESKIIFQKFGFK